jgi:hypothetical protein
MEILGDQWAEVGIPVIRNATRKNTGDPETEMTGFFRLMKKFQICKGKISGEECALYACYYTCYSFL